jgi:YebC/PmpR family DNA-binding regulatory protein
MAGHSHWAGIKHKKGRQDKVRSKLFSKLSREITVAAKLGDKDPGMNPRLRSAIQAAKQSNMPKENINRAISKSELVLGQNYENLRYEGYGTFNTALIIEALTDNKNRTASSIRTILQKNGGRLGETGSTSYLFYNCGVVRIENKNFNNDAAFELAINSGAKECESYDKYHEIICEMKDFYKVKNNIENKISNFMYSGIEWRAHNVIKLSVEQKEKVITMLETLDEIDDIQNIFINCEF